MEIVPVLYQYEDGVWTTDVPAIRARGEGWASGGDSYAEARRLAEDGVGWVLEREVALVHYVPETAIAAMLEEQRAAPQNAT